MCLLVWCLLHEDLSNYDWGTFLCRYVIISLKKFTERKGLAVEDEECRQRIFRHPLYCLYCGRSESVLVGRADSVCTRVVCKECQCLGASRRPLAADILRREEEKTFMEALEFRAWLLYNSVCIANLSPGSLLKPLLIDHLPCAARWQHWEADFLCIIVFDCHHSSRR